MTNIIEIETPMIIREGMNAVRQVRLKYPHLTLLAHLIIMDAGKEEAHIAFEAGADIVTVLGVTNDATVEGAVQSANKWEKQIMIDMMCVINRNPPTQSAINELIRETAKVPVANVKLKKYLSKVDSDISDGIKDVLKDTLSEKLRNEILKLRTQQRIWCMAS